MSYLHWQIVWPLCITNLQTRPLSMLNDKPICLIKVLHNRFHSSPFIYREPKTEPKPNEQKYYIFHKNESCQAYSRQLSGSLRSQARDSVFSSHISTVCYLDFDSSKSFLDLLNISSRREVLVLIRGNFLFLGVRTQLWCIIIKLNK